MRHGRARSSSTLCKVTVPGFLSRPPAPVPFLVGIPDARDSILTAGAKSRACASILNLRPIRADNKSFELDTEQRRGRGNRRPTSSQHDTAGFPAFSREIFDSACSYSIIRGSTAGFFLRHQARFRAPRCRHMDGLKPAHFFTGYEPMIATADMPDSLTQTHGARPFLGIYDYRYAPYSLGDTITWQMNVLVIAIESGANAIDHILMVDPKHPACWMQPHINTANYLTALQNIFPAYLCSPLLRNVRVFRDRTTFNDLLASHLRSGLQVYPSPGDHLRRRVRSGGIVNLSHGGFPLSHSVLNAFYMKNGYLPRLVAPRGYERSARMFLARHAAGRTVVAVHMRQSGLGSNPSALHRDSPMAEWVHFLKMAAVRWPDVLFVVFGGYHEWERPLMLLKNVLVPRTFGLGLAHELALLHHADMFMGSSSGFSAAATFSSVPYVIVNVEHDFSRYSEVPVGELRYPFALDNQEIYWEKETAALLAACFERAYRGLRKRTVSEAASTAGH